MALPPERILIKRKFEDEAPETLYLDHARPKRLRHSVSDYCFRLVKTTLQSTRPPTSKSVKEGRRNDRVVSSHIPSTVPVVQATEPGAELEEERRLQAVKAKGLHGSSESRPPNVPEQTQSPSPTHSQAPMGDVEPRRFHLTRPTNRHLPHNRERLDQFPTNTSPSLDLALFVERQTTSDRDGQQTQDGEVTKTSLPETEMEDAKITPRKKRPKANAAERVFLGNQKKITDEIVARNATKSTSTPPQEAGTEASDGEPSKRVQQIFLDMVREDQGLSDMSQLHKALDESIMQVDPESDYVYETYIRVPRSELSQIYDGAGQMRSIGILVIEEEDQQLWETYAETEDDEWDVEDEDSNAEDNPANEYPEEEVDSDDEFGYGAYRNRHAASDEEEFDLKNDGWSEDGYGSP